MRFKITEFTWIHTSLFALTVGLASTACDDLEAIEEDALAVEELAAEEEAEEALIPDETDELPLADEAEAGGDNTVRAEDERRRRFRRDDDNGHRRFRRDDDNGHRRFRRDDDGHRRRRRDDDNGHRRRRR